MATKQMQIEAIETRAAEDGGRITRFVASTGTPDRMGDVIDQSSWNLDNYRRNPVILWAHDYSLPPVGRAVRAEVVTVEGRAQLEIDVQWDEGGERGREVARQFADGFLHAGSVGFAPGRVVPRASLGEDDPRQADRGYLLADNDLLEFSAVPVPANADALAAKSARADLLRVLSTDPEVQEMIQRLVEGSTEPDPWGAWKRQTVSGG